MPPRFSSKAPAALPIRRGCRPWVYRRSPWSTARPRRAVPISRGCRITWWWCAAKPSCFSPARRCSRPPPVKSPAMRNWVAPRCTRKPPAPPNTWPRTMPTACARCAKFSVCCRGTINCNGYPGQRLVLEGDQPLRLGRRAMDILLILLEHAGNVVSKQQLIAQVWPKSVVEDINLRVHMAALRKALGDGQAGQRYIVTVAQRGYSFVAPFSLASIEQHPDDEAHEPRRHNLPVRRTRLIGRQHLVDSLRSEEH